LRRWFKGKLVIGLAALAVIAFAGGAYAATQSSGPTTRQAFLNDVAKRLHVTPQQLSSALRGATVDQLQAAVKAGLLTQAQANAIEHGMKQNGNLPAAPFGFFGLGIGPGFAPVPGPGTGPGTLPRLRPFLGPFAGVGDTSSAASYLGLTDAQLFQQLSSGKSLAQIATAKGKTVSGLEQAMTAATKSRLDKLVAAKVITAAQEKQFLSRFSARLSQEVNQKGGALPRFRRPALRGWSGPSAPWWGGPPVPGWGGPQAPPNLPKRGNLPKPPATIAPASPYAPPSPIA
jgi:transcriptional regulator with XRE-family HTH domain